MAWQWIYRPPANCECGRLDWTSPGGQVAATVFTGKNGGHGHAWYVWNTHGTGGENSVEATIDAAIVEAEAAARRWKDSGILAPPEPPRE
jgi:hypothetical protein